MYNLTEDEFQKNCSCILFKTIRGDLTTPVLASLKLFNVFSKYHFLFESAKNTGLENGGRSRFSIIGVDPDLVFTIKNNKSSIENLDSKQITFQKENPLENLRKLIKDSQIEWSNLKYESYDIPSICAGIFGYFNYDIIRLVEQIKDLNLKDEINIPDSIFIRPQILIIFDNFFDKILICAPKFKDKKYDYRNLVDKINYVEEIIINSPVKEDSNKINHDFKFLSNYTEDEFCDLVIKAKEYIKSGDIFQVIASQRFVSDFSKDISPFSFYRSLRFINPSPFLFFLKFDDFVLTGSSPEIVVSSKNRKVNIRPLAGTRKRTGNIMEDKKSAEELLRDEKEISEHLMLIDLGRHDVGRVSKAASVKVTEKMTIEYYSHVMHISSNVEGDLRDECDSLDALMSGFPAGTVSGAPKIRAIEIIEELEKIKRSFYGGSVGYFAANGDMESCITLRSALIKNDKIYLQSGAGIVFDSNPKSEYQECINKVNALVNACNKIFS